MRVLFIGGTGVISSGASPLVVERGHDLTALNRGMSPKANAPDGARTVVADARDPEALRAAIRADVAEHGEYDSVVQWICFTPDHLAQDLETFASLTRQYVFISSASAYETPPSHYVTTEATPLANPYWRYSRDKAACEALLREAGEASGFPFTIVRPSHTYGYSDMLAEQAVHIPSNLLARFDAEAFEGPLVGDKTNAAIFDTSKLTALVPEFETRHRLADSIGDSMKWFGADESRRGLDDDANELWDRVILAYLDGVDAMFP